MAATFMFSAGTLGYAIRLEVRRSRLPQEVQALIEAVYQAQREALHVPEYDRQIRYIEHRPEHFAVPPGKSENYTFVEILLFPGRSIDAKRRLYESIVSRFGRLGIAPADIFIVVVEPAALVSSPISRPLATLEMFCTTTTSRQGAKPEVFMEKFNPNVYALAQGPGAKEA